ncbi:MAG: sigma-70 family RNA polymerase sigma factor, partial [Gemmatimonadales bacterium]|nr:sigma-70 family RNA polymerase sigma factor [Gemmatimonadales bacterium]
MDDGELVRRTLAGDRSAFAELVDRYRDAVCGVAYHYLGNFEDVQDAAQEAFVQAYLRAKQLCEPEKFGPWLRRITINVCLDALRRQRNTPISFGEMDEQAASRCVDTRDDVHRMAARSVVRDALGRLTDKARLTVTLFYIDGYSHAEIADFLEVPVNTVRSRLRHAKKRLREEMMTMVADVLNEGKPDPGLTRRAVQQAMERAEEALQSRSRAQAIRHYDEALTVLEKMKPDGEHRRLKMHALRQKGLACEFPPFDKGRTQLYEEALAIARQLGDREMQADLLRKLGDVEKSLELYRELGKLGEQGICLRLMGFEHLGANEVEQGRRCYEQAIPLFEEARALDGVTLCRAMLDLLDEVGEKRFRKLLLWEVGCHGLEKNRALTHLFVHWNSGGDLPDEPPDPWPFVDVFPEVSHLGKFLDPGVPVGGSWSGNTDTYSFQPLRATVTVKSNSERLTVPAGTFEHCVLTEQVTTESGLPDHAP